MRNQNIGFTRHGEIRMAQRGFSVADATWIIENGTEVEGGYLVRNKDIGSDIRAARLAGARLVCSGGKVIMAYRSSRRDRRRLLKSLSRKEW